MPMAVNQAGGDGAPATINHLRILRPGPRRQDPRNAPAIDQNVHTLLHRKCATIEVTQIAQQSRATGGLRADLLQSR